MAAKRLKLTRDAIIDKALDLIERDGLDRLSTRALGESLGVQAMALYHHVPSKDALLDDVTARLAAMIAVRRGAPDSAVAPSPPHAVRAGRL